MSLSLRLEKIASLVPTGTRVCDIGTDHGYLAIELIRSGKAKSVIAADINKKPLLNAKKNIEASGIKPIEIRLCDGFAGIESQEFDTAVIAGMGGEVISGIIERGKSKTLGKTLILQPTTSPEFLRKFLNSEGYEIITEIPVLDNGKLYSVMQVCFIGKTEPIEEFLFFVGKVTPHTEEGALYIKKQQNRCFKCMNALENNPQKYNEFEYYKKLYSAITDYLEVFTEK